MHDRARDAPTIDFRPMSLGKLLDVSLRVRKEHYDLELRAHMLAQTQSQPATQSPVSNP